MRLGKPRRETAKGRTPDPLDWGGWSGNYPCEGWVTRGGGR